MQIEICVFSCIDLQIQRRQAPKMRGYYSNKYDQIIELHNHTEEGFVYKYPCVQYKVINGNPTLVGIEEGAKIVGQLALNEEELVIDGRRIETQQKRIDTFKYPIGFSKIPICYRFITPYVALNQKNYKEFMQGDIFERDLLLQKILIGNILSFAKGIGYQVDEQIKFKSDFSQTIIKYKNNDMLAFTGEFYTNIDLPDLIGLGKSVSRGFGSIQKINKNRM